MAAQSCRSLGIRSCVQSVLCSPWTSLFCPSSLPQSVDVAVVGGGLAGLTAAHDLLAAGKSVLLLEARDQVGGKVQNRYLKNGGIAETGAEFVGPTQDALIALIQELGLETFDTYDEGKYVLWRNGKRKVYGKHVWLGIDNIPPLSWLSLLQTGATQFRLNSWAAQLNMSAPWTHPKAAYWDSISLADWLNGWAWLPDAKFMMDCLARGIWGAETHELSLFYVLTYIAGAGNETVSGTVDRLVGVKRGGQEMRVIGGTGRIPETLAERIGWENIALGSAVESIAKVENGYQVKWGGGSVEAKKVVLAVPPPLMTRISFEPELPEKRRGLNEGMKMGAMGKAIAIYEEPFWRTDEDLNAQAFADHGIVGLTFDNSPEDASFGAILGFFQGDGMRLVDAMSPKEIKEKVLLEYERTFGAKAHNVSDFVLQRWDLEEHLWGGPTAIAGPNVLEKYGNALREAVGGIHFAGTETSVYWPGYMEGAVRSGQRAARDILET